MADVAAVDTGLALSVAQLSEAGGRTSNQDALASAAQDDLACFVVSDGVGGQAGGEVASATVVEAVTARFIEEGAFGRRALLSYLDGANAQIARRKSGEARLKDMSATVAALLIDRRNRLALWAHMGDTRIYLFRSNRIRSITRDHSLIQQMIDAGYCSAGQLRSHPQRSTLCLAVDGESGRAAEAIDAPVEIEAGDRFLLCTDGFWEWITEEEMEDAAAAAGSAAQWLAAMRAIVETRGRLAAAPPDNFTAFAVFVEDPAPPK